jgi:hypothetical protein
MEVKLRQDSYDMDPDIINNMHAGSDVRYDNGDDYYFTAFVGARADS